MRVVFTGTDVIGELVLKAIHESSHDIVLVVTQPDRPKGRGRKIEDGPVRKYAREKGLTLIQPESIKEKCVKDAFEKTRPDIMVVASYGEYIPKSVFEWPNHKSINVHPSLLPRWRGASPTRYTLLEGDNVTGVTIQYIQKRMDAGDILKQEKVPVEPDDNHDTLCGRLYPVSARLLVDTLDEIEQGKIEPVRQDESKATLAPKFRKEDFWIKWDDPAQRVVNHIRAFSMSPGSRAAFRRKDFRILAASATEKSSPGKPGAVMEIIRDGLLVACGSDAIIIHQIQPSGKNIMAGWDFANGYRPEIGECFEGLESLGQ